MHRIDEVIDTLIKSKFKVFFCSDASNEYWAMSIKEGDEYKTGFMTSHEQYIYLRIGQGLKGACATYSQFGDLTFELLSKIEDVEVIFTIIDDQGKATFCLFMNDHMNIAESFDDMFRFLSTLYFPRVAFESVYLQEYKTHMFMNSLKMIEFTKEIKRLRSSMKHRDKMLS